MSTAALACTNIASGALPRTTDRAPQLSWLWPTAATGGVGRGHPPLLPLPPSRAAAAAAAVAAVATAAAVASTTAVLRLGVGVEARILGPTGRGSGAQVRRVAALPRETRFGKFVEHLRLRRPPAGRRAAKGTGRSRPRARQQRNVSVHGWGACERVAGSLGFDEVQLWGGGTCAESRGTQAAERRQSRAGRRRSVARARRARRGPWSAPLREKFPGYPATWNRADLTRTGEIFPSVGSKLTRRIPVAGALPSSRIQEKSLI